MVEREEIILKNYCVFDTQFINDSHFKESRHVKLYVVVGSKNPKRWIMKKRTIISVEFINTCNIKDTRIFISRRKNN